MLDKNARPCNDIIFTRNMYSNFGGKHSGANWVEHDNAALADAVF